MKLRTLWLISGISWTIVAILNTSNLIMLSICSIIGGFSFVLTWVDGETNL